MSIAFLLVVAIALVGTGLYIRHIFRLKARSKPQRLSKSKRKQRFSPVTPSTRSATSLSFFDMLAAPLLPQPVPPLSPRVVLSPPKSYHRPAKSPRSPSAAFRHNKQPYDAYLVLDVEATCALGTNFDWPNEIIEWPVCLLRWKDKDTKGRASRLEVVDEFRSFVKPTWKPQLTEFCTSLTGIKQSDVESAPKFVRMLESFSAFLARNGLIDPVTGERLQRFIWCTDGPFDIRDFVVKQCFISKIQMPEWLRGNVLDVRRAVTSWAVAMNNYKVPAGFPRRSMNIVQQLRELGLSEFQGRQHCGIDDTRNIARIVIELCRRGIRLEPNFVIHPGKRWIWMGRPGEILEEYCIKC